MAWRASCTAPATGGSLATLGLACGRMELIATTVLVARPSWWVRRPPASNTGKPGGGSRRSYTDVTIAARAVAAASLTSALKGSPQSSTRGQDRPRIGRGAVVPALEKRREVGAAGHLEQRRPEHTEREVRVVAHGQLTHGLASHPVAAPFIAEQVAQPARSLFPTGHHPDRNRTRTGDAGYAVRHSGRRQHQPGVVDNDHAAGGGEGREEVQEEGIGLASAGAGGPDTDSVKGGAWSQGQVAQIVPMAEEARSLPAAARLALGPAASATSSPLRTRRARL